jgi:hypothetical protein
MPTRTKSKLVTDARGLRTAVIVPIKDYESMVQELEDLRDAQYATAEGFTEPGELVRLLADKR